jgi:hypothetical protein
VGKVKPFKDSCTNVQYVARGIYSTLRNDILHAVTLCNLTIWDLTPDTLTHTVTSQPYNCGGVLSMLPFKLLLKKADPYMRLTVKEKGGDMNTVETVVHAGGGKKAVWGNRFQWEKITPSDVLGAEREIYDTNLLLEVYDKETTTGKGAGKARKKAGKGKGKGGNGGGGGNTDVLIGKCEVSMMSWISKGSFEGDLEIKNKRNKVSGVVQIKMTFNNPRDKEKQRPPPRTVRITHLYIYKYYVLLCSLSH